MNNDILNRVELILNLDKSEKYLKFESFAFSDNVPGMIIMINEGFNINCLHSNFLDDLIIMRKNESINFLLEKGYRPRDLLTYFIGMGNIETVIIVEKYGLIDLNDNYQVNWVFDSICENNNLDLINWVLGLNKLSIEQLNDGLHYCLNDDNPYFVVAIRRHLRLMITSK